MSFLPRVVPTSHLQQAHARIDTTDAAAQSAGPALAGLLVTLVGAPLAVLVDAVTFVVSAVLVLTLRVAEERPVPTRAPRLVREIREGVDWVYRGSGLRLLALTTHLWFVGNAVLGAVLAPYALLTLGLDPFQLGVATAVGRGRQRPGRPDLERRRAPARHRRGDRRGPPDDRGRHRGDGGGRPRHAARGAPPRCSASARRAGASGWPSATPTRRATAMAVTPDELRARTITTMRSFNRAILVVGAPLGGLLAVQTSNRTALVVATAVFALVVVAQVLSPIRSLQLRADTSPR